MFKKVDDQVIADIQCPGLKKGEVYFRKANFSVNDATVK